MNVCRVCLATEPDKDIYEIKTSKHLKLDNGKSFADVIQFCLDLQIVKETKITAKICSKCCRKIITYYKFKSLALENDVYLKSLNNNHKNEDYINEKHEIKIELKLEDTDSDIEQTLPLTAKIKSENKSNNEDQTQDNSSDDDLLIDIKKIKLKNVNKKAKPNGKSKSGQAKGSKFRKQVCDECGKVVKNLRDHMKVHLPASIRKQYKCEMCEKVFATTRRRNVHIRIKHLAIKEHCKECDKMVCNLKQHVRMIHTPETLTIKCPVCARGFLSNSYLNRHMAIHSNERPYSCPNCDKTFRTKNGISLHRRQVHEKEKTHLCQICSKSYFKKSHLQVHIRSHTQEKPYECPDCGKHFTTATVLKNHQIIHSEVKMFKCELCDMTFVKDEYLRSHMVSHTKEKRFPCQYCGVKFHRSDHARRHERGHLKHLPDLNAGLNGDNDK